MYVQDISITLKHKINDKNFFVFDFNNSESRNKPGHRCFIGVNGAGKSTFMQTIYEFMMDIPYTRALCVTAVKNVKRGAVVYIPEERYLPIKSDEAIERLKKMIVGYEWGGDGYKRLAFMYTLILGTLQDNSIILIDLPEPHLHIVIQRAVIEDLKGLCIKTNSQLIVATHSPEIAQGFEDEEIIPLG